MRTPEARPVRAPAGYRFPRSAAALLPWSFAEQRLAAARHYWIATARQSGPHVTPLWGVWLERSLYLNGHPLARWARDISALSRVSVHLESAEQVVILDGYVEDIVTDAELGARIVGAWIAKYERLAPDPAGDGVFKLRSTSARAWSTSTLEDGTAWDLAAT